MDRAGQKRETVLLMIPILHRRSAAAIVLRKERMKYLYHTEVA